MRKFKFRCWHKVHKRMYDVSLIDYVAEKIMVQDKKGQVLVRPFVFVDIVLLQFTGLVDKDGKEIYEGDIFEADNRYNSTPEKRIRYKCIFHSGAFIGVSVREYEVEGKGKRSLRMDFDDYIEFPTVKIIGNVFENSELLEHKK